MSDCLTADQVIGFLLGNLPNHQHPTVSTHLTKCEPCRAQVDLCLRFAQKLRRDGEHAPPEPNSLAQPKTNNPNSESTVLADTVIFRRSGGDATQMPGEYDLGTSSDLSSELIVNFSKHRREPSQPAQGPSEMRNGNGRLRHVAEMPFHVLKEFTRGGVGQLWVVRDESLNREVLLKELLSPGVTDPRVRQRFLREATITAKLEHPGIVPVYGLGQTAEGRPFYLMRFIRGTSLKEAIKAFHRRSQGPADPDQRELELRKMIGRLVDVCNTLEYAHSHGVLHRDLKPSNILVGQYGETLVVDWGAGKKVDDEEDAGSEFNKLPAPSAQSEETLTAAGTAIGTPGYMSPEQAAGEGNRLTPATDVYGIGATMYHVLTGQRPFDRDDLPQVLRGLQNKDVSHSRNRASEFPPALIAICLKAMSQNPQDRYASARAMADDLERWSADQPVSAYREPFIDRIVRLGRRYRRFVQVAALLCGVIAVVCGTAATITYRQMLIAERLADEKSALADSEQQLLSESNQQLAYSLFEQSHSKCVADDAAPGLLWLARSLKRADELGAHDLATALRRQIAGWNQHVSPVEMTWSHSQPVRSVAFSHDGKTVMTLGKDQCVRLWDVETGAPRCPPLEHPGNINAAALSPRSPIVATAGADRMIQLWDARTGDPIGAAWEHPGEVEVISFSADGNRLVSACEKTARVWNVETGKPIGSPLEHQHKVSEISFNPDGSKVVTGDWKGQVKWWDAATGESFGVSVHHQSVISRIVWSPDGKIVLTASLDNTARTWDAETGQPLGPTMSHDRWIRIADFSPDGKIMVTGGDDNLVRLWETATGKPIGRPLQHYAQISSAGFSPDGRVLLTAGSDWKARLWDPETTQQIGSALNCQTGITKAVFSPDGQKVLTGDSGGIARVWDISAILPRRSQHLPVGGIHLVAMSPRQDVILTAAYGRGAQLWEASSFRPRGGVMDYPGTIRKAAFSPDGKLILICTGYEVNQAQLWNAETTQPLGPPLPHQADVLGGAFTPDGKMFATACLDRYVRLWDVNTQQLVGEPLEHPEGVYALAISPDGKTLLTGCTDNCARRWNLASKTLMQPLLRHDEQVCSVAFSTDGKTIVTGSYDHTARLWDAETGLPKGMPLDHGEFAVEMARFTPDGETLVTGMGTNQAVFWNLALRKPFGPPHPIFRDLRTVCLTPDGKRLLASDQDKTICSWNVPEPMQGCIDQIALWATVRTGMELDETDKVRPLDANTWLARRRSLEDHQSQSSSP